MKTKRTIIKIDETLCNGCGHCIRGCHEGALQLIDGKARIISELYCDGLGACIGECPVNAITLEEREAEPYSEIAVMERMIDQGEATILAHLKHLQEHGEEVLLQQAIRFLQNKSISINLDSILNYSTPTPQKNTFSFHACPGKTERSFTSTAKQDTVQDNADSCISQLRQWPIQLHLLNPQATFFQKADVTLAADCAAYSFAGFHQRFMRNQTIAIACPKLDMNKASYLTKIIDMIDQSMINTLTVIIMEVPCCNGLLQLAIKATQQAKRKIPIKKIIIGIQGDLIDESWI